jgi:hypothetical protein
MKTYYISLTVVENKSLFVERKLLKAILKQNGENVFCDKKESNCSLTQNRYEFRLNVQLVAAILWLKNFK